MKRIFFLAVLAVAVPFFAGAHPHMFFSNDMELVWNGTTLAECRFEWTFDQFFSADIMNYDYDRDGVFNRQETADVYNNAFIHLKNYYYFIFLRQGNRRTNPAAVKNFSVIKKGNAVAYRFSIDLPPAQNGPFFLAVYDYTFFCSIDYNRESIKLSYDPALVTPQISLKESRDYPVYYNPTGAIDDTTVYYEWKPGLERFYPVEIKVSYEKK